ncbi:uncharacterized protein LOC120209767 [Hibiscus syriacus]|uniref:uncharacterized protein LOC120209767 n=1 Tax=Hibiscus syriacus TaxID=106335 RepID=UPI0019224678|nr:uncharacterized protein LOC120209767 [Hibiscus syriacus]
MPLKVGLGIRNSSLSLLLFNFVGELLNLLLRKAVSSGLFCGLIVGCDEASVNLSHLQFAYDLIIFCSASKTQVINVKRILHVFEVMSGLKLNLSKRKLFGINIDEEEVLQWANAVGCSAGHFLAEYLGLPLGAKRSSLLLWDPVVQNFYKRLVGWKAKTLSMAGRLILMKAVLSSLPTYFMSLFKIPSSVIAKLNYIMAIFLWGGGVESSPREMDVEICKQYGVSVEEGWSWHVQLRRNLSDWKLDQFSDLMALIHNITLSLECSDGLVWRGNGEGVYTVNSSVKSCCPASTTDSFWMKYVWRGLVPPKVEADESSTHLFFTCVVVWSLWNKFLNFWGVCSFQANAQDFLFAWEDLIPNSKIWSFIPGVVLWSIWKWRNAIVFDGGSLDQNDLFFMARSRLASWFLANFKDVYIPKDSLISDLSLGDSCSYSSSPIIKIVPWSHPPKGFIKLNVDATVTADWRKSGVGGILRVEDGSVVGSFKEAAGPGPPILIELMAIKKGLSYFTSIQQRFKERLIVESDSKLAVDWVKNKERCPLVYIDLVNDIGDKFRGLNGIIRWVARSANVEADTLAKDGIG